MNDLARWVASAPDAGLTWGRVVDGGAFIDAVAHLIEPDSLVVEIGPGYGRLLAAAERKGLRFRRWVGVDISDASVRYLQDRYPGAVWFSGDFRRETPMGGNVYLASLVFKHLYPDFGDVLARFAEHRSPGGVLAFDLIEGRGSFWEPNGTFVHRYTVAEVEGMAAAHDLTATFGEVVHDPTGRPRRRLLVTVR